MSKVKRESTKAKRISIYCNEADLKLLEQRKKALANKGLELSNSEIFKAALRQTKGLSYGK